jgi:hypothetical protein
MSGKVTFHTLIKGLAGAVIDAQDSIEKHQISNLRSYFDKYNRPISVDIRLPSMHPEAAINDEVMYRAPLLPLVSTNTLKIREVEISFDAELTELVDEGDATQENYEQTLWEKSPFRRQLAMNAGAGRGVGNVHVKLRVEGAEPTDGAARLINHLAQGQGVYKSV